MPDTKEVSCTGGLPAKTPIATPPLPDPTYEVTKFLSWLRKLGGMRSFNQCKKKCESLGLDIDSVIRTLNPHLCAYRYKGEKVVRLENTVWACQWAIYYNLEIPHHRHWKRLEKIISDTERKKKV